MKTPFPDPGSPGGTVLVDGSEVSIIESTERWSEIHLEDRTVLRVKPPVISAIRIDNKYDQDGNPMHAIKGSQLMTVMTAPEHLRRGGKAVKVQ